MVHLPCFRGWEHPWATWVLLVFCDQQIDGVLRNRDFADAFFNSACIYEIPVLKHHAKKLLEEIPHGSKEYPTVKRIVSLLKFFEELDDDASIPCDSILREFIGGSIVD